VSDYSLTKEAADFAVDLDFEDFDAEVLRIARRCVLDGLAVALAGSEQPAIDVVERYTRKVGGASDARVIGDANLRLPAHLAAFWNGLAGHAMDWDDTQLAEGPGRPYGLLTHPTMPPLSSALAISELLARETGKPVDGRRFLTAFLAGFEVECKIAEAINPDHYMKGFHSSGTLGTFGSAVTAAKLLGFDRAATARTIGLAASMAAGIRAGFGTMTKPMHVGRSSENGVTAALLVREGFTGNEEALDGQWGYLAVAGRGGEPELVQGRFGKPFSIVDPGVSIKPYPSGVLTHPSMDAMLDVMRANDLGPDDVEAVNLYAGSNVIGPIRFAIATSELEGKFCFPFLLSAVILQGKAGKAEFTDAFVQSDACQAMQRRITAQFDQSIEDMGWERIRSRIEVRTRDGRDLVQWASEDYRGGPHNPLSEEDLEGKFRDCAAGLLDGAAIQAVFDFVWRLEDQADATAVLDLLDWRSKGAAAKSA
jgi:2-methylcitrate dehydratase PrpD